MQGTDTLKVLMLDGSRSFSALISTMLRGMGVRSLAVFDDSEAAITFLRANPVDVILVDGALANATAFKFAMALRQDKQQFRRTVPMILLSGSGGTQVARKAVESGFDALLPKPIRAVRLYEQMLSLMRRPRVYIHARIGYCGPDRRRPAASDFSGANRRDGETFQVHTKSGPVSLDRLEKLQAKSADHPDLEVLLVRGVTILSGYKLNAALAA
ncbi:response regulator [Breoghania sp. L-A4]|uniref:response regulator n=1 Tax=Breoghania sp. L-A4 TaxID=2304600 RepID=UPI0013C2F986|nr:response regulator [Breoghania sp. L-A4]